MAKKPSRPKASLQHVSGNWKVTPGASVPAAVANENDVLGLILRSGEFVPEGSAQAALETAFSAQRRGADQTLVLEADAEPGEAYVLAVRHASGAIRFELPQVVPTRRGTRGAIGTKLRFRIEPGVGSGDRGPRRGLVGDIVKTVLLRVARPIFDAAVGSLAAAWEKAAWRNSKNRQGMMYLDAKGLRDGRLRAIGGPSVFAAAPQRNLLLIHGTFSCAESFVELTETRGNSGKTFLESAREIYQDRIFAFNHFTVSETPEENARQLLSQLPASGAEFDVITHSRGGLVLRSLVEQPARYGDSANRFKLGRAILVASPNGGTPLAQTGRFHTYLNWLANLLEVFPDNPFTFGSSLVVEGLKWIASAVGESIPGLAAMNPDGEFIGELQSLSQAPRSGYSALASNYSPTGNLLARIADLGMDALFAGANDLVVPTEGGWRIADDEHLTVPSGRIGCFGPGGNLATSRQIAVSHTSFFKESETIDFLLRALRDEPQLAPPLDPDRDLPFGLRRRGAAPLPLGAARHGGGAMPVDAIEHAPPQGALEPALVGGDVRVPIRAAAADPCECNDYSLDEILHLFVITRDTSGEPQDVRKRGAANKRDDYDGAQIIAGFRNARVVEPFIVSRKTEQARGMPTNAASNTPDQEGLRWKQMKEMNQRIENWTLGDPDATLPSRQDLISFGRNLFETLFPGQIRRMYDAARVEVRDRRLAVVLTTMFPWMAAMPWEFSYDPTRRTFLCVEDINFQRNIVTAVPADAIPPRVGKLRILVVAAQPIGAVPLSAEEEEAVIRRAFERLETLGLAEVTVITKATIGYMHRFLEQAADGRQPYDILHFIGHGEFDEDEQVGRLLFEDDRGGSQPLPADILRQIVRQRGIRLVFLNACETGRGDAGARRNQPEIYIGGVAPALVQGGVPSVVANQYSVLDPSAAAFAEHFYWSLANGRAVGDAVREARISVNYSIAGEAIDWAVPVLYARNPGERLVARPLPSVEMARHANQVRNLRRRGPRRDMRIGVWDINYVIPTLEQILNRLNEVQDYFEFEVITAPAPVGTWRRIKDGDGQMVLEGDEVAEKLSGIPAAYGVDGILCVTGFKLQARDEKGVVDTDLILYGGLDDGGISIFSVAGFAEEFEKPDFSAGRLIANMLVSALNCAPCHADKRGPANCPNYYNEERGPESVFGSLEFCPTCRRKAGVKEKAYESLLKLLTVY